MRSLCLYVIVLLLAACSPGEEIENPPNIVVFLVDDMGWQDTSEPFWSQPTPQNQKFRTPNMERLADQGMKFTQAYSYSVCSPTRVSLMTGMSAARHRVTNWTLRYNSSTDAGDEQLEFPVWNVNGMTPVDTVENAIFATPLPQLLSDAGYFTVHAGKAHLGAIGTPAADPENLGFRVNIAGHAAGAPASYLGEDDFGNNNPKRSVWAVPGLKEFHGKDVFLTEALTRKALDTLAANLQTGNPFFLYMSHYAVHTPIMADDRYFQKYLNAGLDTIEARYASMVEGMDKSLGDIMDFLEKHGLEKNTVIMFMSDNGGLSAHARGGEPHTHNWPLASGKGSAYEGGIREPMIVKWPGKTRPGSSTDAMVIIEDFYPTILSMAGLDHVNPVQIVDGVNFIPVLETANPMKGDRALFWHYPNKWGGTGPGIGPSSTIRKGSWKLIYFHKDRSYELYNIDQDIKEENNLADTEIEVRDKLAAELGEYLRNVNAQMPVNTQTGMHVEYPDML